MTKDELAALPALVDVPTAAKASMTEKPPVGANRDTDGHSCPAFVLPSLRTSCGNVSSVLRPA